MEQMDEIFNATPSDGKIAQSAAQPQVEAPADTAPVSKGAPDGTPTTPMTNLACRVMSIFRVNYDHRLSSGVTERLDYCLRAHRQRFAEEQMAKLREMFPNSDIPDCLFSPITSVKNRALRSILVELVNQAGEPLFHFENSPVPDDGGKAVAEAMRSAALDVAAYVASLEQEGYTDENLPPEAVDRLRALVESTFERRYDDIMNEAEGKARERVKRLEKKVWDIIEEGGGRRAFMEALDNFCVFGTCLVVGPVMRNVAKNTVIDKDGVKKFRREVKCIPTFESVNPMDCYPAPGAVDVEDGPLCITVKFTGEELHRFAKGVSGEGAASGGWMGLTINEILARHTSGGVKLDIVAFDPERRECENNGFDDTDDCTFEGVRCFAPMRGSDLIEMGVVKGLDGETIQEAEWYRTESIVIDNRVVYVCIHADEMGIPVSKACCYTLAGSWWGEAIADKVAQCQCLLNNTAKSILVNQSMTSAPMGYVSDVSRLTDKSPTALKWRPGKIFGFTNGGFLGAAAPAGAPMGVLTIPSTLNDSLALWKMVQQQADLDSGLPAYSEGQSAGASGAMRTAQGLNTFVENTMRGCKSIMTNLDKDLIARQARLTADWVLVYDKDQTLKGDVYVRSVGLIGRILKTQRDAMRLQLLNLCLNSQLLTQAIGVKGVIEMFRPSLEGLDLNPDEILPSKAKVEEQDEIMRIAQLIQAARGAADQQAEGGGMQSGVAPVAEAPQGGVAERRGAA